MTDQTKVFYITRAQDCLALPCKKGAGIPQAVQTSFLDILKTVFPSHGISKQISTVLVQWVPFLSCPWTSSSLCLPLCPSENSLVSLCSLCSLSSSAFFSLDFFLNHHPRKQKKPQIFKSWLPSLFLKEVALAQWLINNFSHFQSKPTSTHLQTLAQ